MQLHPQTKLVVNLTELQQKPIHQRRPLQPHPLSQSTILHKIQRVVEAKMRPQIIVQVTPHQLKVLHRGQLELELQPLQIESVVLLEILSEVNLLKEMEAGRGRVKALEVEDMNKNN